MKQLVQTHVSKALLVFCVAGLVIPGLDALPTWTVIACLAGVIYMACFKLHMSELKGLNWLKIGQFYGVRYLVFPAVVFTLVNQVVPNYATAVLLLALAPPATSSAAFTHLLGGNVALAFALTVVGNLLSMALIPLGLGLLAGSAVRLDLWSMLATLGFCIALPVGLFTMSRKVQAIRTWTHHNGSFWSVLLIGMTFTVAAAKRRDLILEAPAQLLWPLLISSGLFVVFYAVGWFAVRGSSRPDRVTYGLASGANNISLVVSVALLYFPPETALFLLAAELPWVLALGPFRRLAAIN